MKHTLSALQAIVLVALGAVLLHVALSGSGLVLAAKKDVSSAEFISIILTALGVMLTAVTVLLGALALIGWATFESRVKESAESFLDRRFSEQDPRYLELVDELKREALKGTKPIYKDENESPYSEDAA